MIQRCVPRGGGLEVGADELTYLYRTLEISVCGLFRESNTDILAEPGVI